MSPGGDTGMPIKPGDEIDMPTRNIVLTPHHASFVEQLVSSGRYQSANEVLREGLRLIEQREAEDASRLDALRNAVQVGVLISTRAGLRLLNRRTHWAPISSQSQPRPSQAHEQGLDLSARPACRAGLR